MQEISNYYDLHQDYFYLNLMKDLSKVAGF